MNSTDILRILEKHTEDKGRLIAILEEIQDEYGYLPEKSLRIVSDETCFSMVDVYGVATFNRSFSLTPRGKHLICACLGTACHVRSAPWVVEEFERQLGIKAGQLRCTYNEPEKAICGGCVNLTPPCLEKEQFNDMMCYMSPCVACEIKKD